MRTADSGTLSVSSFVASSPSMPGMRTSMITTFGRRRSASATADAPSDASPITRMCGARDSDRRRPSRTTSWSSTMRQVISDGPVDTAGRIICRRSDSSDGEAELLGLRGGLQPDPAAVPDAVFSGQLGHLLLDRTGDIGSQIEPALVQLLVPRHELGPVPGEVLEEVLAGAR